MSAPIHPGSSDARVMIVDDSPDVRKPLVKYLQKCGYKTAEAADGVQGLAMAEAFQPQIIILDLNMPRMGGLEFQAEMTKAHPEIPIIIITGYGSMHSSIQSIRSGAYDYLTKPLDFEEVGKVLQRCFTDRVQLSSRAKERGRDKEHPDRFELLGSSPGMIEVFKSIGLIARTDNRVNVLIFGETGSGKELVARQLHNWGKRSCSPFVAINITALPDSLIESELFGHEKGAFTGADKRRNGKLEQASDGSVLLDEIGDFSPQLQSKLLRVLQEREFYRLGGSEAIPLKARVIAATHKPLAQMVKSGEFREDLYFRMNVATIDIPPLRARRTDIPLLAREFLRKQAQELGEVEPEIGEDILEWLSDQDWHGNVRELENSLYRAMIAKRGGMLSLADVSRKQPENGDAASLAEPATVNIGEARRIAIEAADKRCIIDALRLADGQVPAAAKLAGVNRESFYRLMRKYGVKVKEVDS